MRKFVGDNLRHHAEVGCVVLHLWLITKYKDER